MIKAVIFDMDGLLIDSEPFWRQSHMSVLATYGHKITEEDVRGMAGRGTPEVIEEWRRRFGWEASRNPEIMSRIVDEVHARMREKGEALPGVHTLIKTLTDHDIPMAVASSSSPQMIASVLERLQIRDYFKAVHSGEHEKRSKPFPDVFLSTAKSLGVKPANCLVLEDSLNGVKAAKAAGMKCVAVPERPYDETKFAEAQADKIVPSLEVVDWTDISAM